MNIPDYTLLQSCGRGAYGQVWLAQSQTNKLVALKYVAYTQAGEREFEGLVNFSKLPEAPNLIRILHLGKLEDGFFYTMELADGLYSQGMYVPESLAERIKRQKRLSPAEVMDLAFAMLGALNSLHAAGLIHRDIKPENILYVNGMPKLSDMGLVRDAEGTVSLCGTIGFIPPERLVPGQTSCNKSDDLYALGKVLYCALTGHSVDKFPSFREDMIGNTVCSHLNRVILKACGDPSERFANVDEFISALKNGVEQKTVYRSSPGSWIKKTAAIAGGVFALFACAGIGYFLTGKIPAPDAGDHAMPAERKAIEEEREKLEEERKKLEAERRKSEEKAKRDQMAKAALFGGAASPVVEDVKEEDDETARKIQALKQEREKLEEERKKLETANQVRLELDRREEARREEDRKRGKVIVTSE